MHITNNRETVSAGIFLVLFMLLISVSNADDKDCFPVGEVNSFKVIQEDCDDKEVVFHLEDCNITLKKEMNPGDSRTDYSCERSSGKSSIIYYSPLHELVVVEEETRTSETVEMIEQVITFYYKGKKMWKKKYGNDMWVNDVVLLDRSQSILCIFSKQMTNINDDQNESNENEKYYYVYKIFDLSGKEIYSIDDENNQWMYEKCKYDIPHIIFRSITGRKVIYNLSENKGRVIHLGDEYRYQKFITADGDNALFYNAKIKNYVLISKNNEIKNIVKRDKEFIPMRLIGSKYCVMYDVNNKRILIYSMTSGDLCKEIVIESDSDEWFVNTPFISDDGKMIAVIYTNQNKMEQIISIRNMNGKELWKSKINYKRNASLNSLGYIVNSWNSNKICISLYGRPNICEYIYEEK